MFNKSRYRFCFAPVVIIALSGCASVGNTQSKRINTLAIDVTNDSQLSFNKSANRIDRHVYGAIGVGASRLQPDASSVPAYTLNDRVEPSANITLGVDLSRQWSLELHAADLGSAGFSPEGHINYHTYGASALFYMGKNRSSFKRRGLSGFGRVGYGILENTPLSDVPFEKDNATHILFGAGLEYMTAIGLGLRAEVISYEEDAQLAQLGVVYRMGARDKRKAIEVVKATTDAVQPIAPVMTVAVVLQP